MLYAVEPTLASEPDRGTIVRGGCQNYVVTKVTTSDHHVHVTGFPHYDDDIDVGGVRREIKNRPESHFCLRTDELIDRVIFSGERAEFGLEDEI